MQLNEVKLSSGITAWLEGQGYTVWTEVPVVFRCVDIVGRNAQGELVAVELKWKWSKDLYYQSRSNDLFTTNVWAAAQSNPAAKTVGRFHGGGIGMLQVLASDNLVRVIIQPSIRTHPLESVVKRVHQVLNLNPPGGRGGLPNLKGVGPAIDCSYAVRDYLRSHPKAKWEEIWRHVPNHYSSARSMNGALRGRIWKLQHALWDFPIHWLVEQVGESASNRICPIFAGQNAGSEPTVVVRFIEPTDVVKKDSGGRVIGLDDWRLEPATLYLYQVYAYDKRGRMSAAAQTANFTTPVAAPASLTATAKP